jgi:glycosyltransferase involved in cell wall biosynthesis
MSTTKYRIFMIGIDTFLCNAGLSLYTKQFLDVYPEKIICFNINSTVSSEQEKLIKPYHYNGHLIYEFNVNNFNIIGDSDIIIDALNLLINTHREIKCIIYPDFIFGKYIDFDEFRKRGIKLIMFIHMLYRGCINHYIESLFQVGNDIFSITLGSWIEDKCIKKTDNIICNSHFTTRVLRKYYPEYKGNYITIPLGVDKLKIPFSPQLETDNVIYFGRLHPQKGIEYLLMDINNNKDYYKKNPLTICAGLSFNDYIKRLDYDYVKFLGAVEHDNLIELLKLYKYCIFPSIYEPYCLALNEALCMGKVCIVNTHFDSGMLDQIDDKCAIMLDFQSESFSKFIQENVNTDWTELVNNAHKKANDMNVHYEKLHKFLNDTIPV